MRTLLFCNLSLIGISLVNAAAVDNDLLLNPDGSLEGIDPNVSPPNKLISPNFPPSSYLGFSLDTTATMPLDIDSITTSVKTFKRLIRLPTDGQVRSFAGGAKWKVPTSVTVKETHQDASTKIKSFPEGSVAAKAFDDPEGWEIITGGRHGFFAFRSILTDVLEFPYQERNKKIKKIKLDESLT